MIPMIDRNARTLMSQHPNVECVIIELSMYPVGGSGQTLRRLRSRKLTLASEGESHADLCSCRYQSAAKQQKGEASQQGYTTGVWGM